MGRHKLQKNGFDCGVAAVAIIADCSYGKVLRRCPVDKMLKRGLNLKEIGSLLNGLTGVPWRGRFSRLESLEWLHDTMRCSVYLVLLKVPGEKFGHYVAVIDGAVYDPWDAKPVPMELYGKRHWKPWRVFVSLIPWF